MSVIVTLRFNGDPAQMEAQAAAHPDRIHGILDQAKQHGLIAHRFYGSDGQILVIDEWPDEASFQKFFDASPDIGELMKRAGAGEPDISFWHHLDVKDDVG